MEITVYWFYIRSLRPSLPYLTDWIPNFLRYPAPVSYWVPVGWCESLYSLHLEGSAHHTWILFIVNPWVILQSYVYIPSFSSWFTDGIFLRHYWDCWFLWVIPLVMRLNSFVPRWRWLLVETMTNCWWFVRWFSWFLGVVVNDHVVSVFRVVLGNLRFYFYRLGVELYCSWVMWGELLVPDLVFLYVFECWWHCVWLCLPVIWVVQ
jgi:hypothetical protein